jgi:predicted GIY-YIG superfamily endonuclease
MPKTAIDFSKTIIYKLVCKDNNVNDVYVGYTTNFTKRKYQHKSTIHNEKHIEYNTLKSKTIRKYGGWKNWEMVMIEQYSCKNNNEAKARENYWINKLKPKLNTHLPYYDETLYLRRNSTKCITEHCYSSNKLTHHYYKFDFYITRLIIVDKLKFKFWFDKNNFIYKKNDDLSLENI